MKLSLKHLERHGVDAGKILDREEAAAKEVMASSHLDSNPAARKAWAKRRLKRIEQLRQQLRPSA